MAWVSDPNQVESDHYYFWNGTRWTDLADIKTIKKLLLPQVFFCQETAEQELGSSVSTLNSGGDVVVTFNTGSILINNGNNITLNSNQFKINNTGKYEISGYINYNPRVDSDDNTNLLYKIQRSTSTSGPWTTIGQTTLVWGEETGGFSRTLIIPPTITQLTKNDILRVVVTKSYGSSHGSDASISIPGGLNLSKNIRIFKLD